MSEWRVLKTGRECFEAMENGEEVQVLSHGTWWRWVGDRWRSDAEYRARPRPKPKVVKHQRWLNLDADGSVTVCSSNDHADRHASPNRVECRLIEWEVKC